MENQQFDNPTSAALDAEINDFIARITERYGLASTIVGYIAPHDIGSGVIVKGCDWQAYAMMKREILFIEARWSAKDKAEARGENA